MRIDYEKLQKEKALHPWKDPEGTETNVTQAPKSRIRRCRDSRLHRAEPKIFVWDLFQCRRTYRHRGLQNQCCAPQR
ncbi:MAG: hypothetical protein CMM07_12190 [Rhodopirellula sp.]|nr:hypothetical protein [Rhodopirellula sp.]